MTVFSSTAIEGKHILITGATGGIGQAAAEAVVKMGAKVTITGRDRTKLEALQNTLLQYTSKDKIYSHAADISDEADQLKLVESSEQQLGFISGLVNSHGITGREVLEKLEKDFLLKVMDVNFISTVMLTKLVYKNMKEQKEGNIINISSISGLRGTYSNTAYSGSKFALIGFTESLAEEAAKHNIKVNAVCPGFVDTEMAKEIMIEKAQRNGLTYEEQLKKAREEVPTGQFISTEEVANTIAFLLTDATKNIIGTSLKITGGRK